MTSVVTAGRVVEWDVDPFDWEPPAWYDQAACKSMMPGLWYAERGEPTEQAKAVCATCPVRAACLEHAITRPEKHGVWGGLSERERRRLRRAQRLAA